MDFSEDVLANIKTIDESDEEEFNGPHLFEVLSEVPAATENTITNEAVVNDFVEENEDVKADVSEDPLLENVQISNVSFRGEYDEHDFMDECSEEELDQKVVIEEQSAAPSRRKKSRISNTLKGRNGQLWSSIKPAREPNVTDITIQQLQPKGKGPASTVANPLEAWQLLMDERVLTQIVNHTNEAIRRHKGKASHERATDAIEVRAWLGLNYLCGIFRNFSHCGPLDELWTWELGNSIFRATMSVKRFEFLGNCLRYGETSKAAKKGVSAEYAQIHELWEKFLINCRSYYAPSGNCTIDTHMMKGTKTRPGAKLITLCDAKTLYMCNAVISLDNANKERDVLQLVCDIKGTKRNIVLPEQYTSLALATKLLGKQLTVVGALSPTAKEVPPELLSTKMSQKLYADAATLSVNENDGECLLTSGLPSRINSEKLYHLSCDACQHFHECAGTYSTNCATPDANERWSLSFFHQLLDYAAVNAWILLRLSERGEVHIMQREFQRDLGLYLTQQQLKRQLQVKSKLTLPQKLQVCEVLGEPTDKLLSSATAQAVNSDSAGTITLANAQVPEGITLQSKLLNTRMRCRKCRGKRNCTTRTRCQQCLRPLCYRYLYTRCNDCMGLSEEQPQLE